MRVLRTLAAFSLLGRFAGGENCGEEGEDWCALENAQETVAAARQPQTGRRIAPTHTPLPLIEAALKNTHHVGEPCYSFV